MPLVAGSQIGHAGLLVGGDSSRRLAAFGGSSATGVASYRVTNMRILALETTDPAGGVAAMLDGNMLAELDLCQNQRSAQSLAPAMLELFNQVGWAPQAVQLVAVSVGPGSFTGLRVGVTAAKVFAYAVGANVLGIDTLEAIAAAAPSDVSELSVAMDAQRGELVVRPFARRADGWIEPTDAQKLVDANAWLNQLPPGSVVTGPVLARLANRMPPHVRVLDPTCWRPRAAMVARLAAHHHSLGRRDDVWKLVPHYFRRSAAEEKCVPSPPRPTISL
jgi:tRNA threonylcarbamoyladenosine biosynthesis protein TsaB